MKYMDLIEQTVNGYRAKDRGLNIATFARTVAASHEMSPMLTLRFTVHCVRYNYESELRSISEERAMCVPLPKGYRGFGRAVVTKAASQRIDLLAIQVAKNIHSSHSNAPLAVRLEKAKELVDSMHRHLSDAEHKELLLSVTIQVESLDFKMASTPESVPDEGNPSEVGYWALKVIRTLLAEFNGERGAIPYVVYKKVPASVLDRSMLAIIRNVESRL